MNAVVKESHVETIFDYELTDTEKTLLTFGMSYTEYLGTASYEGIYLGLAALFGMRGDKVQQQKYIKKLDEDFIKTNIKWDALIH